MGRASALPPLLSSATTEIRQFRRQADFMTNEVKQRDRQQQNRNDYSAYDRALIRAKESQKLVTFTLATGEVITDCTICSVDKFQIEVEHETQTAMKSNYAVQKEWLNKALISRTRVQ